MVLFNGSSCLCVLLHFFILRGPARGFMLSMAGARPSHCSRVLGNAAQCQHIKADVAYTHRFVQVKFDDGDLFYRALMAEKTPTMAAKRKKKTMKDELFGGRTNEDHHKWSYDLKRKKGVFFIKVKRLNTVCCLHTSDVSWW